MLEEFKKFALRGNAVDMAVGIIIGGAFGTIVQSIVQDILMPPIGLLVGNVSFQDLFFILQDEVGQAPYPTLEAAQEAGAVTINYGLFITNCISFLIVAWVVFLLVRGMNRLDVREKAPAEEPTTKNCPFCTTTIPIKAVRCPACTSELQTA